MRYASACPGDEIYRSISAAALTSLGYVFLLASRSPSAAPDVWVSSGSYSLPNLLTTGPLFLIEIVSATLLAFLDPALLLIALPLGLCSLMRLTAQFGLRRTRRDACF